MKKIIHAVSIHASPERVYDAVATANGLAGWWSTSVRADEREGGIVDFTFIEGFNPDMKVTTLKPGRQVAWTCVGGHEPWKDNTFRFDLEGRGDATLLVFTQEYARELSDEEYGIYNFNWGYYLNSLKQLCEKGTGAPFQA